MPSARIALALLLAACGSKSNSPSPSTGSAPPAKRVDAPAVSASGVVAKDESAPPVVILVDAKGRRSLASAASWKDLSAARWSAGPKSAGDEPSYRAIKEGTLLGLDPKRIVDQFTDYQVEAIDDRTSNGVEDDPPPPEEDDGADESGGTGTAMELDEGKMGKKDADRAEGQYKMQKDTTDPQLARQQAIEAARNAGILGETRSGRRGHVDGSNSKTEPVRQAAVQGEVTDDKVEHLPAVVVAHPSASAASVVKAVGALEAMIAVKTGDQIRPLHIQFHDDRHRMVSDRFDWLEVRLDASGVTVEAVPSKATTLTWTEASGKLRAALAEARERKQWTDKVPVDVLVADGVDAQHLIDTLVELDGAGVKLIGLGLAPIGEQLAMRGKEPDPRYGTIGHSSGVGTSGGDRSVAIPVVSLGAPSVNGDLDKAIIRRYVKRNIQKVQYCYEKELLAKPSIKGTVTVQFLITPEGKVAKASGSGFDKEVASCVTAVIQSIEFPKPKGNGEVQVSYPFTFAPAK